jgi:hypothetical protein
MLKIAGFLFALGIVVSWVVALVVGLGANPVDFQVPFYIAGLCVLAAPVVTALGVWRLISGVLSP